MKRIQLLAFLLSILAVSAEPSFAQQPWSRFAWIPQGEVRQVLASKGYVWARTDSIVYQIGNGGLAQPAHLNGSSTGMAQDIGAWGYQGVWIACNGTLNTMSGSSAYTFSSYILGYTPDGFLTFSSGRPGRIWSFADGDTSSPWYQCTHGDSININAFSCSQDSSIWVASDSGVSRNTRYGATYFHNGLPKGSADLITVLPTGPVIATFSGLLYRTRDNGLTWTQLTGLPYNTTVLCMTAYAKWLFVGGKNLGVHFTTDEGDTWIDDNTGLNVERPLTITSIAIDTSYWTKDFQNWMYASTDSVLYSSSCPYVDYKTPPGGVRGSSSSGVLGLTSFPNPFTLRTTIPFSLPRTEHVSLKIFDILGHEIATLADQDFDAGPHEVEWNAEDAMAGAYFCRVVTADGVQTSVLVKEESR